MALQSPSTMGVSLLLYAIILLLYYYSTPDVIGPLKKKHFKFYLCKLFYSTLHSTVSVCTYVYDPDMAPYGSNKFVEPGLSGCKILDDINTDVDGPDAFMERQECEQE